MVYANPNVIPGTRTNTSFSRGGGHVPVGRRSHVGSNRVQTVFRDTHVLPGTRSTYTTTYVPTTTTRSYSYVGGGYSIGGKGISMIVMISLLAIGIFALFPLLLI